MSATPSSIEIPKSGTLINACDQNGIEYIATSLGWRVAGGRLLVRDNKSKETKIAYEWKYPFEGTSSWRK